MIAKLADNIYSPLGTTTLDNYRAVANHRSALRRYRGERDLPEPFTASLLDRDALPRFGDGYTPFERLAIASVADALGRCGLDPSGGDVLFILSTTKGNIELLDPHCRGAWSDERLAPAVAARVIAGHFGNRRAPLVVSNACTSGLCAQIAAMRAIGAGTCRSAIVVGADLQSRFIISGFQAFHALDTEPCRPFDASRAGLNAGEAAATVIYTRADLAPADAWHATRGAIRNDANHISGPSRTGEGSFRALQAVTRDFDTARLAVVNVHGTATPYNDEMEAIALDRAGLLDVPVNTLKGYYGHTMGAAGVLETVLTMCALDHGTVLATRGFNTLGVSRRVNVSNSHRPTAGRAFVKLLSGFGGCNAAMLFEKGGER